MVGRTEIRYAGVKQWTYRKKLINQRCRYAELVEKIDYELSTWLKKNRINVDEQDVFGGSEVYLNPIGSANRIRKEILGK